MASSNHVAGTLAVAVLLCVAARLRRRCRILNDPTAHARDRPSRASTTAATAHASSAHDRSSHSKPPTPSKAAKKARRAARRGPSEADSLDHYSLTLEYDGTSYCGSQKQISHKQSSHKQSSQDEPQRPGQRMRPEEQRMRPEERGRRTVQGDLESALTQLIGWQPSTGRVSLPLLFPVCHTSHVFLSTAAISSFRQSSLGVRIRGCTRLPMLCILSFPSVSAPWSSSSHSTPSSPRV